MARLAENVGHRLPGLGVVVDNQHAAGAVSRQQNVLSHGSCLRASLGLAISGTRAILAEFGGEWQG